MRRRRRGLEKLIITLIVFLGLQLPGNAETIQADVVIYGGTSAAVMAAVQLARADRKVIIVCPDQHLGGLSSGGLGFTDTGNKAVIGGLAREFYQRIYAHYQKNEAWKWQAKAEYGNVGQGTPAIDGDKRTMWIFEPHVAEGVFDEFIKEYGIKVYKNHWLDRQNGVIMEEGRIVSIQMLNKSIFKGKVFIDATYEGDLMAAAGVSYHVGRESNNTYQENWNGVQVGVLHHKHHFGDMKISPYVIPDDPESGLLYGVSATPPGEKGAADRRLQAYCFRMCLTQVEENKLPISKPENYDPSKYELLVRILDNGWDQTFQKFDPIPNLKTDVNNHGPFSFDFIGMNYDYPEAGYEQRRAIIQKHEDYQRGLLYFYMTDPRVPSPIQKEMKKWGLAKDEFTDNGHWPHQIYVREARRMIGAYVMTEHEVLGHRQVPHSIGMGSYVMDSHNTQRYITPEGYVQNEGDIGVKPKQPYQIAMGAVLPKKAECTNLIVPVAVSSSHIAFGSIRMEPVFMILGQSAAVIAEHAIDDNLDVQDVEYSNIKGKLAKAGQILSLP